MYFLFTNTTLRFSNLKTRTDMNAEISVSVICVEAIMCLLLHNLQGFTFKKNVERVSKVLKSSKHHNIWFQMKEHLNIQCSRLKYLVFFLLSDTSKSKTQTFYSLFSIVLNVILNITCECAWKFFLVRWILIKTPLICYHLNDILMNVL